MPFSPEQAKNMLEQAYNDGGADRWMAAVNSIVVDVVNEHAKTRHVLQIIAKDYPKFKQVLDVLSAQFAGATPQEQQQAVAQQPQPPQQQQPAASQERVGADGEPLSPGQAAVENMMDAAIEGGQQEAAPAQQPGQPMTIAQRLGVPPKGGQRAGGGAAPVARLPVPATIAGKPAPGNGAFSAQAAHIAGDQSDDAQAQLEAMMDGAAGPRQ